MVVELPEVPEWVTVTLLLLQSSSNFFKSALLFVFLLVCDNTSPFASLQVQVLVFIQELNAKVAMNTESRFFFMVLVIIG